MHDKSRRIQNELVLARHNTERAKKVKVVMDQAEAVLLPIEFACECSEIHCTSPINMTIDEFAIAHQHNDQFVVIPGHEQTDIESIIVTEHNYLVVEKYALKP